LQPHRAAGAILESVRRNRFRNPAQRLRSTVERLPERTRRAMLEGIRTNRIIVGAYTDPRSGGVCPMLAAHRNGGRTDLAAFAVAWDAFTDARRPRLATRREVRTLRSFLELSLLTEAQGPGTIAQAAARIRAESAEISARLAASDAAAEAETGAAATPPRPGPAEIRISRRRDSGERHRAGELRDRVRWAWMRPARRLDEFKDLIAVAEEQLAERRAADLLGPPGRTPEREPTR